MKKLQQFHISALCVNYVCARALMRACPIQEDRTVSARQNTQGFRMADKSGLKNWQIMNRQTDRLTDIQTERQETVTDTHATGQSFSFPSPARLTTIDESQGTSHSSRASNLSSRVSKLPSQPSSRHCGLRPASEQANLFCQNIQHPSVQLFPYEAKNILSDQSCDLT